MASVLDVAEFILKKQGSMTAMKLQKLCYYAQAWSLVWDERPLFQARIEAWSQGPVIPNLYQRHRGEFEVDRGDIGGDSKRLTATERETVDAVLKAYGNKSSQWLSDLTHQEAPWREARKGLNPTTRSNREITRAAMFEYYGALYQQAE